VEFRVVPSGFAEHGPGRDARARVEANARGKARDVAAREGVPPGGAVLGADTEVVLDGAALGTPADEHAAGALLDALAGRAHEVLTAVVLVTAAGESVAVKGARVHVRPLTAAVRRWYLDTGEWRGRAGGYAVQGAGAALVTRVEGDHSAVVGLPVARVADMLAAAGLGPWGRP